MAGAESYEVILTVACTLGLLAAIDGFVRARCSLAAIREHRDFHAGGPRHRIARGCYRRAVMRVVILLICLGIAGLALAIEDRVIFGPEAALGLDIAIALMIVTSLVDNYEGQQLLHLVPFVEQRRLDAHQGRLRASMEGGTDADPAGAER